MHQSADDPILKKEIVWQEVLSELEKRIASNVVAQAALQELERAGCSRRQILERLFMFAAIPAADVQAAKALHSRKIWSAVPHGKRHTASLRESG